MANRWLGFAPAVMLAAAASAAPLSMSDWQAALAERPTGDPARGLQSYEERGCAGCHGAKGVAESSSVPVLAGQRPIYLGKMLLDYRHGRIEGGDAGLMSAMATGLDDTVTADLSAWLGSLPRPAATSHSEPPRILKGDRSRLLPPCEACHGANGQGWEVQPVLTGQNRAYLESALRRFKSGERANDVNSGMGMIAKRLTDEEIRALADYYGR